MRNWFVFLIFIWSGAGFAQLSPGKLTDSHAHLEGLRNCTRCHEMGDRRSVEKCLKCHVALQERIAARKGLHARKQYRECGTCHVEHQGRDYALIFWPEGEQNFDHRQTGYPLQGKHKHLKCAQCHTRKHLINPQELQQKKVNPAKTFLGLNGECGSCHIDDHRGQFKGDCSRCHNMESWKPAVNFDHRQARFTLVGRHQQVSCEKCHPRIVDNKYPDNPAYLRYTGLRFHNCTSCHKDVHANKLGSNCRGCHSPEGWEFVDRTAFDHQNTRFPLLGKHKSVACLHCHPQGAPLKRGHFEQCSFCHEDYHLGQFAHRASRGACEECHQVQGFTPALFSFKQHAKTRYPLQGSHLAVPCNLCHTRQKGTRGRITLRFQFRSTRCNACHQDPHKGEVARYLRKTGCESCHYEKSWKTIDFDHNKTHFPLIGKHETIRCRKCHPIVDKGTPRERLQFVRLLQQCIDCHVDIHEGQFKKSSESVVHCERCHTPEYWFADKFDHNRDSAFKLEGAHQNVPCEKCHPPYEREGKRVFRYKSLDFRCQACHGLK